MKTIRRIGVISLGIFLAIGSTATYQYVQEIQQSQVAWDWHWKAWKLQQKRHWVEAEQAWKMALRYEKPQRQGHIYLELAKIYQKQKQNQSAIDHYQKALSYDLGREQCADAHLQLGDLLNTQDSVATALPHWQEAARLTPVGMPLMAAGYMVRKEAEARLKTKNLPHRR
jgi:tetratricopeptide (TPR) repeat protein